LYILIIIDIPIALYLTSLESVSQQNTSVANESEAKSRQPLRIKPFERIDSRKG